MLPNERFALRVGDSSSCNMAVRFWHLQLGGSFQWLVSVFTVPSLGPFLFIFTLLVIIHASLNPGALGPFLFIFTLLVIIQASLNLGT